MRRRVIAARAANVGGFDLSLHKCLLLASSGHATRSNDSPFWGHTRGYELGDLTITTLVLWAAKANEVFAINTQERS